MNASLKGEPSARGIFFKNHRKSSVMQWMPSFISFEFGFKKLGSLKQIGVVICAEISKL
jgi:hypothetical protein